jgi:hypothetical protein
MFTSLLTLFQAISGGIDWQTAMATLQRLDGGNGYALLFCFYIFFMVLGVLNVVTGAFVDSFAVVSQRDRDVVVQDEMNRNRKYIEDMRSIFEGADTDGSGTLTMEEFEKHLVDERVKAFFATLDLPVSQVVQLFTLLDADGTDEICIGEFVTGCLRLKGDAKAIDVNMLLYQNEYMLHKVNDMHASICKHFSQLNRDSRRSMGPMLEAAKTGNLVARLAKAKATDQSNVTLAPLWKNKRSGRKKTEG